jgi:hypothetical protein
MAAFGGSSGADASSTIAFEAEASQQPLLTMPQHT